MFEYSSITLNPESEITIDLLNQMVLNDSANERMRKIALEPPLAFALMDNNKGTPSDTPGANTTPNALYYAKNETAGITLNVDNVINSPLSVEVTVDRSGVYRFYVVAHLSSGASDCIPSFQITDVDADVVQEIGGYITSGTQDSATGNFYTPSILFVDRWLYGGKTYRFTVTTGLLGTNSDIAYINGYQAPPTIAYFWVQGYNGTGQQIELPDFQVPSFSIDIPDFDLNFPDFSFPDIGFPDFDFDFGIGGGFDNPDFNFDPDFPFGGWGGYTETFNKGTGDGFGPDFNWDMISMTLGTICPTASADFMASPTLSAGTVSDAAGIITGYRGTSFGNCSIGTNFHMGAITGISDIVLEVPPGDVEPYGLNFSITVDCDINLSHPLTSWIFRFPLMINGTAGTQYFQNTGAWGTVEYSNLSGGAGAHWNGHGPSAYPTGNWPVVGSLDTLKVKFFVGGGTSPGFVAAVYINGSVVDGPSTFSNNGGFNVFWTADNGGSQGASDPDFEILTITPGLQIYEYHSTGTGSSSVWTNTDLKIDEYTIQLEEPWDFTNP